MADPLTLSAVGWGISVAGWIVSPIVTRVLNEGFSHIGFPASARRKLKNLEAFTIPQLQLVLQAAEEGSHRERFKQLMTALKDAFYEAEDILDAFHYHSLEEQISSTCSHPANNYRSDGVLVPDLPRRPWWRRHMTCCLPSSSHHTTQDSGAMLDRVPRAISKRELRNSLDKIQNIINEACKILPLQPSSSSDNKSVDPTTSSPPMKVFGRDKDCARIITMLHETLGDNQPNTNNGLCYSVIGIYGIPGSGKTTLAQCVCDYERKGSHFDLVMWIHVTQNFMLDDIFREMFDAASTKSCPTYRNLDTLERNVGAELRGKRFFLVLDDIWCDNGVSEQKLDRLLRPLRAGKSGSKILVTTRSEDAARYMGALSPMQVSDLDEEDFFELFMHYATNGANIHEEEQETFNTVGRDIANKLKRSPLSATLVATQLRRQPLNFWRDVREQDLLTKNMGALWWSYQHLDEQVRRCFAYCSIFPTRHPLKRDELVNLWIAEGLVKTTNGGEQMENIGQGYFDALVSCSFLQQTGRADYSGTVRFTIHDLLHDVARGVAGSDCSTIFSEDDIDKVFRDVRHLFIDCCDPMKIRDQICRLQKLRTLIFGYYARGITDQDLGFMLENLRKLRVLKVKLKGIKIMVPASIGHLKHLRCVSIEDEVSCRDVNFEEQRNVTLPCTFDRLYHLQILELPPFHDHLVCSGVKNISNLISLRHIRTCSPLEFPGIGRLNSLRTLDHFRVRNEHGYKLQQLKMLKYLSGNMRISGLENVETKGEALEASLAYKEYLSGLALEWKTEGTICPPDQADVLEGLRPPPQIARLEIRGYSGRRYSTWFLANHNNLRNLKCFKLKGCNQLKALPEIGELYINLRELRITSLPMLKELPPIPKNLKTLRITSCPSLVLTCTEDADNIRWMFYELACQAGVKAPLTSTGPEEIYGLTRSQFDYFKKFVFGGKACTLTPLHFKYLIEMVGRITSVIDYPQDASAVQEFPQISMGTDMFPMKYPRNYCGTLQFKTRPQLLLPKSVEHLKIHFCIVTDTALKNCLSGCCNSLASLDLCGILCLTAIPSEVMKLLTKLRKLLINFCVNLTLLHGLNHLSVLEELSIRQCPNLTMTRQDSEKVRDLRSLTIDDISLVPDLLSAEGCSSLTELRIKCSEERKEAEFLQQLTSLDLLEFDFCKWDTLPENLVDLRMLDQLVITNCENIRSLPTLPESLRLFHLNSCDQNFMVSCRTPGKPNWQKIEHVKYKVIQDIWDGFTNIRASLTQENLYGIFKSIFVTQSSWRARESRYWQKIVHAPL